MANVIIDENYLSNIANNIRAKTGSNNTYNIYEMSPAIENITTLIETSDASSLFSEGRRFNELPDILSLLNNVTNMSKCFYHCENLTDFSENIFFNTSNVTNMSECFWNCYRLFNVHVFNMSSVTNAESMFVYCNQYLSSESYANIANSLPLATNLTNQYISNIGLDINRFNPTQILILNNKGYTDAIIPANSYIITGDGELRQ